MTRPLHINSRALRNISLNTVQVLANQFLGVFIFLLLSRFMDKDLYGEFNWSLAVLTLFTTVLGLRLEQIVVRNVAAGQDPSAMLSLFIAHNLVAGSVFFVLLLGGHFLFPVFFREHSILLILSISQLLTFFSLPFRQLATGRSAFGWLAVLSTVSNLIRCGWLGWLAGYSAITLPRVLMVFTLSAFVEFGLGCYIIVWKLRIPFSGKPGLAGYRRLILESLPQAGVVFLNAGIARIDWILMGVFLAPGRTAEYSFAYRAYEFSPFPLLVLAPLLLNSFARHFAGASGGPSEKGPVATSAAEEIADQTEGARAATAAPGWLDRFAAVQSVFATLLPLWLVLAWTPLVDGLTGNKYGRVNATTFLILSCSIPFQYLINIFWTADFAANRLKHILRVTAITGLAVIAGDLVLIPFYGGQGAAVAYLGAMVLQCILYGRASFLAGRMTWCGYMLTTTLIAFAAGGLALLLTDSVSLRLVIATAVYAALVWGVRVWGAGALLSARKQVRSIDWPLLLFLVLFFDVKLYIKIAAVLLAFILHRSIRFSPAVFARNKWWWFYLSILGVAASNLLLNAGSQSSQSLLALAMGCSYWLLALAAAWHIYWFVQRQPDKQRVHDTVTAFFLLNMLIVFGGFLYICVSTGTINPYTFRGEHQKYYINTGDFLTGVGLDTSVTAAMTNAFALFYFLYRDKKLLSLAALVAVLLAGSNWIDLLVIVCAAIIFVVRTDRTQKAMIIVWSMVIGFFLVRVSPENTNYARLILERITGKNAYLVPPPLPHPKTIDLIERKDVTAERAALKSYMNATYTKAFRDSLGKEYAGWNYSGRLIAWNEMGHWFRDHPVRLLLGAGVGRFSSRSAYKTSALHIDGSYPVQWQYIDPLFRDNYLYIYLYYHTNDQGQHSIVNEPNSVYGQLLGEYGLAGLLAFAIFYIGFFIRGLRSLSYGLPILLLMGAAFVTDYWFEQLSVVVLFELLMLLDRKTEESRPEPVMVAQSQSFGRGASLKIPALRFRHRRRTPPIANRQTQIKDT